MKKSLYPKTPRFVNEKRIIITEKLDGSNLGIFRLCNDLIIAQRNNMFTYEELIEKPEMAYKGLIGWLSEHKDYLLSNLNNGSGVFGEWLGMGKIKYPNFDKKFYIFAKARIDKLYVLDKLNYDLELLKYAFIDQIIPDFIGVVPVLSDDTMLGIHLPELNHLYRTRVMIEDRKIEGFIVIIDNEIAKYVRYKKGKFTEHKESK